mgnify:CR=1 FL=1
MDIKITKATELKTKPTLEEEASLGFGKRFTDHMFMMNYDNGEWHDARIVLSETFSRSFLLRSSLCTGDFRRP